MTIKAPKGWYIVTDKTRREFDKYWHQNEWITIYWDGERKQNGTDIYARQIKRRAKPRLLLPTAEQCLRWLSGRVYELQSYRNCTCHKVTLFGVKVQSFEAKTALTAVRAAMKAERKK